MTITVYLQSDEYGYEEFERANIKQALQTIKNIYKDALGLHDGVERKIGILVNKGGVAR